MKRHSLALIFLLASTAVAQERPAETEKNDAPADRGVVAVVRRDGVMFPFASFRGDSWSASWPASLQYLEIPINLDAIPERWWGGSKPDTWAVWFGDGRSQPLQLKAPVQFRVHCSARLGIRTDYQSAEHVPLLPVNPYPKDGLAATAGVKVESIEILKESAEWSALAVALLDQFNKAEDAELSAVSSTAGWSHPVPKAKRRALPVRIESWYRTNVDDGIAVSYIEAVRRYPPQPEDEGCGLETLFSGWVYHDKKRPAPRATLGVRITYCDRVNASYMLPLGRIQLKDKIYWIAQMSGHESEAYGVARLSRDKATVILDYFVGSIGGCRAGGRGRGSPPRY